MNRLASYGLAACSAALLAACGGGGSAPAAADAIPASASQSPEGMVAYLLALSKDTPDDREPLDVSGWSPPRSDTTEPQPLP